MISLISGGTNNMPSLHAHAQAQAQAHGASPCINPHLQSHAGESQHAPSCGSPVMNPQAQHSNGASTSINAGAQLSHGDGGTASPTMPAAPAASDHFLQYGRVMTDEQFETLRRQISVYSTICSQLVEMHQALMTQQALMPNMMLAVGQQLPFDPVLAARSSGRQRWTPSQIQLQILENVFEKSNGTPSKQRIKEITVELGKHGSISETNVYNWFQNRKARAKRKQQHKDGESELELEEVDLRKDKRAALEMYQDINGLNIGRGGMNGGFSGALSNTTNAMFAGLASSSTQSMQFQPHVDGGGLFNEGLMQKNDQVREFSTIVVLIDGKPWEVPSTTLDLKGSFGETSALLDSQRQVVPTDERGFTTCPLHPGENYNLIQLNKGVA